MSDFWEPLGAEIHHAIYEAEEPSVAVEALIRRAALKRAVEELEKADEEISVELGASASLRLRLAALRAELEEIEHKEPA